MSTYLYNGVALADIYTVYTPELQKSHPFAYIGIYYDLGVHFLYVASQQATYNPDTIGGFVSPRVEGFGNCIEFEFTPKYDETWHLSEDNYEGSIFINRNSGLLWCNTPVYNVTDGTLYLAASEPVPVGGDTPIAPDIHPPSFMAGLRMGQIVRAMRG